MKRDHEFLRFLFLSMPAADRRIVMDTGELLALTGGYYQVTWINMVPTIIAYLLNAAVPGRAYRFPGIRFGRSASAPLPPARWQILSRCVSTLTKLR